MKVLFDLLFCHKINQFCIIGELKLIKQSTPIAGGYNDYDKIETQLDMYGAPAPTLDASSSLNISKKTIDRRSDLFNEIIYSE